MTRSAERIFTGRTLDAADPVARRFIFAPDTRPGLVELAARHGVALDAQWPLMGDVRSIEYDIVDCPLLRFKRYFRDALGRLRLVSNNELMTTTVDELLLGDLPAWWQPEPAA